MKRHPQVLVVMPRPIDASLQKERWFNAPLGLKFYNDRVLGLHGRWSRTVHAVLNSSLTWE